MSGNESPGGDDSLSLSLSTSSAATTKSIASSSRDVSSIHQLDPKYKNYVTAIDKALKSFEYSSEWHDLISALTKLNKVITTWSGKYGGDLPRLHLVTKRLSQCLHPNLPGGVHLKTLETYELIFKSIPPDKIKSVIGPDLFSFAAGLFPLWTYASEQSRPTLLRIYEMYLLPLIKYPALEGFLISILSGLSEDDVEPTSTTPTIVTEDPLSTPGRVSNLLDNVNANVGVQNFNKVLWQVLKSNSKIRLAGINYVIRKSAITEDESLAVETLICCLVTSDSTNESVLIQRATLDLLLNQFRLTLLDEEKKTKLIKASLQTLLRRDMSLNRRLFSWLLGNDPTYFETNCKSSLTVSCIEMLNDNNLSSSEIVRILISLLDKPEISILDDILLYIVIYFKRIDSKQCANLFFVNLKPEYVFEQIVAAIETNVKYCSLLEYLIELDISCFEYEKLLPGVFKSLVKIANQSNIIKMEPVLKLILKRIELDPELFHAFIQFYLNFVQFNSSEETETSFNFDQFLKPKVIDNFWTDFKLCRERCEENILEKFSNHENNLAHSYENLCIVNSLFEELLDPRILKEISDITNFLKALIVIGCYGDIDSINLLVKVLKLLEKSLCFEIVEQTYLIELATRFLWDQEQFETLSELICLNKLKVEKILLSFLKDYENFQKLIQFLDFVGDFGDVKLLVYKLIENLDCSFEQYPLEFLELRDQAEEFCCKMLRENDLRFLDVFISNLLVDFETVGDQLSRSRREKESFNLGTSSFPATQGQSQIESGREIDMDRISIEVDSVSDSTSEFSYKSLNDNDITNALKTNSTPDLTNLAREEEKVQVISRSMGDLSKISEDLDINIPEIVVQDDLQQHQETATEDSNVMGISAAGAIMQAMKFSSPLILTPSTEMATEAKAKSTPRGFSKKLSHPHLKVSKELSEDVLNRILYVLSKIEKFLLLKPDLFINYLKSCNTNQSARINFREDCIYLELLIGKLLDFMCVVIPSDESFNKTLQLGNLNVQFKSCAVLKLLLDRVIESERLEMAYSNNSSGTSANAHLIKGINSTPTSNGVVSRRQNAISKLLKRKSSIGSGSHFIADLITRVKVQRTLLFVLRSTTTNFKQDDLDESISSLKGDSDNGTDLSLELIRLNYGQKYLTIYQGLLLSLSRTVISLETLINSVHHQYYTSTSKSHPSLHRNHPNHKYLAFIPLTNQPLFHEILLTALELRDDGGNNINHFNWMDLNLHILPYIITTTCPVTSLTVAQVCKNLQILGQNQKPLTEAYILRSLDFLIAITNAVLFRNGEKSDKPEESNPNQSSSSIYGIITSFLPGSSSTSPKIESIDEVDSQSKDILTKLDILLKTSLAVKATGTLNKLKNLLNPICNSYLQNFLTSLSILPPSMELTELCKEIETIRVEKLTIICTRILNRNLLLFYRDFVRHTETIEFNANLLNSLLKECLSKSMGLVTICEIINDIYNKFKPDSWSKQELKELQENLFKIFDKLVAEVCNQNSYMLLDSNSGDSSSSGGPVGFLTSQGLQGKTYNFKRVATSEETMEEILSSMSTNLPSLVDLLWTDDKDRDKVMPMLTHLLGSLILLIKMRHTSTSSYVSILKLLKNMSYYSYFRKSWKKDVFEMLLLEPGFFQMIKPHYYYTPTGFGDSTSNNGSAKAADNQCVVQIWKVIMDNLFTQDKSSFSELLTRVSVPQTSGLNIFTSKDTEFEGRALLLKRLAFVIWSSEQDQFCKFITNIQERLAEALKTPNSPQIVPVILRSVFLCFRVLILKFSNLSALWPIIIHEVVQVLIHLEKQLMNGGKLDHDQLACALEVFKLIQLLSNLPTETLPLFQMYRWAFIPSILVHSSEESLSENNNINSGFVPFLSRISILVDDSSLSLNNTPIGERQHNPCKIRILPSLCELIEFLNGNCDTLTVEEMCQELDLDFIEC